MRPKAAINKPPTAHRFKLGGKGRKQVDTRFAGPCCGGTRKVGDFNRSKCSCCPERRAVCVE